jgi:glutamyl-tRNA synthetase
VVDDHDMGVTHIIRGDDHLTNAARQIQIYDAMGWDIPVFAHIPLIHGPDGKKLSKRHGAVGLHEYAATGYPAAAMRNYLARLGWSHGDDELFDDAQAMAWFDLGGIGKAPARLDFKKLEHVSGYHIAQMNDAALLDELASYLAATDAAPLTQRQLDWLRPALPALKAKAKTLPALLEQAHFALIERPVQVDEKAAAALDPVSRGILKELTAAVQHASWERNELEAAVKQIGESHGLGLGKIAAPLRAALAGRSSTPSVFDMMTALGRDETLARLQDQAG